MTEAVRETGALTIGCVDNNPGESCELCLLRHAIDTPNTGRIILGAKVDEAMAGHVKVTAVLNL